MKFSDFGFPGTYVIHPPSFSDERGRFVKTFHAKSFGEAGLRTDWREEFYSSSGLGVVRGMHFQVPPAHHAKLVSCLVGKVIDVAVDLRRGSPTEGQWRSIELNAESALSLYFPSGIAHGFQSLSEASLMLYKVTSEHAPELDGGIAWDSFGFDWPIQRGQLSERDLGHPALSAFKSPFVYEPSESTK